MEFDEVVRRRRMVRSYDPDRPVPPEVLDALLAHARRAPSAGNTQGWAFLVLTEPADRDRYWAATRRGPRTDGWLARMSAAPLIVVVLAAAERYLDRYAEPDKGWTDRDPARWPVPYWHVDAGFAALLMHLTAVDRGLGSCFFGVPGERVDALRAAFGVPAAWTPVGALTVGHPAPDQRSPSLRRGRRPEAEVVHHGRWGGRGRERGRGLPT